MPTLVIDIGGTHIKILAEGHKNHIKITSGPTMTPQIMTSEVLKAASDWNYDRISIGYPGPVEHHKPSKDPHNLGPGWVEFPFETAFGKPIRMINDAAMQALGSYKGGRLLFLGLGTGLGSALVIDGSSSNGTGANAGIVQPMELAHLPYRKGRTYEDYLGLRGLERLGKKRWRRHTFEVINLLCAALQSDKVVLGGGNAKYLGELPKHIQLGANDNAFKGGFKLWEKR